MSTNDDMLIINPTMEFLDPVTNKRVFVLKEKRFDNDLYYLFQGFKENASNPVLYEKAWQGVKIFAQILQISLFNIHELNEAINKNRALIKIDEDMVISILDHASNKMKNLTICPRERINYGDKR